LLREKAPDLILCDIMMPGMDGLSVLATLKDEATHVDIPFIFVTALGNREQVRMGMSAGADDYLPKPFLAEDMLAAIYSRIRRHELIKLHHAKSKSEKESAFLRDRITNREREVLLLVGQGATSKEIAERLGVCQKTVEVHRANLMKKLHATNAVGLARWAVIARVDAT